MTAKEAVPMAVIVGRPLMMVARMGEVRMVPTTEEPPMLAKAAPLMVATMDKTVMAAKTGKAVMVTKMVMVATTAMAPMATTMEMDHKSLQALTVTEGIPIKLVPLAELTLVRRAVYQQR
ncbi:hypothetical protein COOONC_17735 [Cooperia oncophora]